MKLPLRAENGMVYDPDNNIMACCVHYAVNHKDREQDYRDAALIAKAVNAYRAPADGLTVKVRGLSVTVNVSYYQPAQDAGADEPATPYDIEFDRIEIDGHDVFHVYALLDQHLRAEIERAVIQVLP